MVVNREGMKCLMSLNKQEAVGGKGGYAFDSGCNISGLRKVHIHAGPYAHGTVKYHALINRVFFEFDTPFHQNSEQEPCIHVFGGVEMYAKNTTYSVFLVPENDPIARIDVWSDNLVTGLQFTMASGAVSQVYGSISPTKSSKSSFEPKDDSLWQLVGIHGSCGTVVDSLGFTFGRVSEVVNKDDEIGSRDFKFERVATVLSGEVVNKDDEENCQ
ncbi:unnamed protein product [Pseudo-nitzschia multistriata]|uniref:Jacalin-type lectin domain-containing protein n=1 Tax=Pseudo-nitzschia multistriata TaxID=183589 RepID=A0A448ZJS6_9STRA|nr:unnamed protein product [Pseudo-nitzschia multistriata]